MITSSVNRVIYKGNGVATEFAYPFKIFDRTDIKVLLVDKDGNRSILTSDYYVDMEAMKVYYPGYAPGAEEPETERPSVLAEGETLVVYREVPITQMDRLPEQHPFNVIEKMDDKSCVIDQQLADKLTRAIVMGEETALTFDGKMPPIQPGKTLRVKEDGSGWDFTEDPAQVLPLAKSELEAVKREHAEAVLDLTVIKDEVESAKTDAQNAANVSSLSAINAQQSENNTEALATEINGKWDNILKKTDSFVTPEMFGAIGDGVTDDTQAIQQALEIGGMVIFNKKYKFSQIRPKSNTKLIFTPNCELLSTFTTTTNNQGAIDCRGTMSETYENVTAISGKTITVDSANCSVGDYVLAIVDNEGKSTSSRSVYKITSISGNVYIMDFSIAHNDIIGLKKITPLENIELLGHNTKYSLNNNTSYGNFIQITSCANCTVDGFIFDNGAGKGVCGHNSHSITVSNCAWRNKDNISYSDPFGEPFAYIFSTNSMFKNCKAYNCRRGIDFAGAIYSKADNCVMHNGGFTCHGMKAKYVEFNNCSCYRSDGGNGLSVGNTSYANDEFITVNNCSINGVNNAIAAEKGSNNIYINNCTINDVDTAVLKGGGAADVVANNITFKNCKINRAKYLTNGYSANVKFEDITMVNEKTYTVNLMTGATDYLTLNNFSITGKYGTLITNATNVSVDGLTFVGGNTQYVVNGAWSNIKLNNIVGKYADIQFTSVEDKVYVTNCNCGRLIYTRTGNETEFISCNNIFNYRTNLTTGYDTTENVSKRVYNRNNIVFTNR